MKKNIRLCCFYMCYNVYQSTDSAAKPMVSREFHVNGIREHCTNRGTIVVDVILTAQSWRNKSNPENLFTFPARGNFDSGVWIVISAYLGPTKINPC